MHRVLSRATSVMAAEDGRRGVEVNGVEQAEVSLPPSGAADDWGRGW